MRRLGDRILLAYTIMLFVFLYTPIVSMALVSFNSGRGILKWESFTLEWYTKALSNEKILNALFNSAWVAVTVTLLAIAMALLAAIAVGRYQFRFKLALNTGLFLAIVVPEIVEALTLMLFFLWIGSPFGASTVIIGHLVWFPIVYVVIRARMAGMPRVYEEAARVLGANELQTFFKITLPLLLPGIITGGLLIFTWSWDSFIKTQFTRGPGFETLPIYIWNSVGARGRGLSPEVNAIATLSLIISIALAYLYTRFRGR
ncbi:MAG TPA: ABC transporter permease [Candidatus Caldiarchaeum subterraneum]|uniref:ABC transporter permease n=1 Tax=Caldiarchaeum subterraneum TaxID=311458 RepID=A0A832ZVM8_CALS0|nr:ABC transporter permease [Candidatus Caldarchaeum subterraneum]